MLKRKRNGGRAYNYRGSQKKAAFSRGNINISVDRIPKMVYNIKHREEIEKNKCKALERRKSRWVRKIKSLPKPQR